MPFEENNEIITGFFETNETPHRHTATDLLINMDPEYVYNIAKAATGAMLHFAVASTSSLDNQNFIKDNQISFYPNPAKEFLNINLGNLTLDKVSFTLVDINGRNVIATQLNTQNQLERISVASIPKGIYLAVIETDSKRITKKVVID